MSQFTFKGQIRGYSRGLRRLIGQSARALWLERLAHALWPVFTVVLFFVAVTLLGLFERVVPSVHYTILGLFVVALLVALVLGFRRFRAPRIDDAVARLDREDKARPLSALQDQLAGGRGSPRAEAIWQAYQRRAEKAAEQLTAQPPDLRLGASDRWALRLFAPALAIAALIGAGEVWSSKFSSAFSPRPVETGDGNIAFSREPAAEAWASPPSYTDYENIYLTALDRGATVTLPEGTEITIRVTDLATLPALEGDATLGLGGFTSLGTGLSEAVIEVSQSGLLEVRGGEEVLAAWNIEVIPDAAPQIEMKGNIRTALTGALEFEFTASDDHGLVTAWAEIVPEGGIPENGLVKEPIVIALPLPIARDTTSVEDQVMEHMTDHPWAGARVEMILNAEDGAGQVGTSEPIRFTLPERRFSHPMALALIEQRRELALDFDAAPRVLDVLQALIRYPEEVFADKRGAYLGSRMAIRRLAYATAEERVAEEAEDLVGLIWDIALSLEGDGELEDALERLRAAEEALRDALENGTEEDIRQAMDDLRQAMNEFLEAMARHAQQNPQQFSQQQQDPNAQQFSQQDLQEMLDQMQRMAENGLRDQARDMLNQLSQMMENLRSGQQMQAGQTPGQQALKELQEMIQRQRDLADRTFDELRQQRREQQQGQRGQGQRGEQGQGQGGERSGSQQGQSPGQGDDMRPGQGQGGQAGEGNLAQQQEELRQALEELRRQLEQGGNNASEALGEAGDAMGGARDALEQGSNSDAVQDQMEALDRLQEGAEALAESIQNGQGDVGANGQNGQQGNASDRSETDPFDRQLGNQGTTNGQDTAVPDRSVLDRAREILDELRRRSSEAERPELELDYFERLLDEF